MCKPFFHLKCLKITSFVSNAKLALGLNLTPHTKINTSWILKSQDKAWGDGSLGKSACFASMRTQVQMPSIHAKAGMVICACNHRAGGRDMRDTAQMDPGTLPAS